MYISTSYYRVLVQELRVFRPQNAPNSVPWNMVTGQYTRVYTRGSVGTLPSPGRATVPSLAEGHEGPRFQLEPFLTRLTTLASAAALRRVVPEFRVNLHELNRVAEF